VTTIDSESRLARAAAEEHGASKSQLSDSTSHTFDGAIAATEDLYDVLD